MASSDEQDRRQSDDQPALPTLDPTLSSLIKFANQQISALFESSRQSPASSNGWSDKMQPDQDSPCTRDRRRDAPAPSVYIHGPSGPSRVHSDRSPYQSPPPLNSDLTLKTEPTSSPDTRRWQQSSPFPSHDVESAHPRVASEADSLLHSLQKLDEAVAAHAHAHTTQAASASHTPAAPPTLNAFQKTIAQHLSDARKPFLGHDAQRRIEIISKVFGLVPSQPTAREIQQVESWPQLAFFKLLANGDPRFEAKTPPAFSPYPRTTSEPSRPGHLNNSNASPEMDLSARWLPADAALQYSRLNAEPAGPKPMATFVQIETHFLPGGTIHQQQAMVQAFEDGKITEKSGERLMSSEERVIASPGDDSAALQSYGHWSDSSSTHSQGQDQGRQRGWFWR